MSLLDPEIQKYMYQQQLRGWLNNVAQGLIQAGAGGADTGPGLLMGVGQGGTTQPMDPMQAMALQEVLDRRKQREQQKEAFEGFLNRPESTQLASGAPTGAPGQPVPAMALMPGEQEIYRLLGPEKGMALLAERSLKRLDPQKRERAPDVAGYLRYVDTGERVFPDVQAPDPNLLSPEALAQEIELAAAKRTPDRALEIVPDESSSTGFRYAPRSAAGGQEAPPPSGLNVQYDPSSGAFSVRQGRGVLGQGLSPKTQGAVEQDLRAASEGLARLSDIQSRYRREYQTVPFRWDQITSAWQEKLTGAELRPETREELINYTAFRRDATDNLNRYIKEITGAQMSVQEAERITRGLPNPGTGLFDGDSPPEFEAKMDATVRALRKGAARQAYALSNSLDWRAVPLDDIENIMRQREQEIMEEIRGTSPEIDDVTLHAELKRRLAAEFGLSFQ